MSLNRSVNYMETTCVALINELQKIWDEVGEPEKDRDKMLLELEQECLEAYRRKVDQASRFRAQLRQAVADSEAKLAYICASLGEQSLPMKQFEASCLKKELAAIFPQLEMMEKKKSERKLQFIEILDQIHNISKELCTFTDKQCIPVINESDLSLRRLEEFKTELQSLEKEKSDRMKKVLDHLNTLQSLCVVLGMDFKTTLNEIHPTLDNPGNKRSISADTIDRLSIAVSTLNEIKIQRLQRVQDLATTMVELWNLMDISDDEQQPFHNVSRYIAASENEVTEPNALSVESIKFTETEISRLQQLKASKIKEVLLKKRADLEQLYKQAHMPDVMHGAIDFSVETLESGAVDPLYLLEQVENQISNVKEEAFSRKDILEKLDKWLAACEEETWLEEYNMDHNRYNACRGTHLLLKRAEKARTLVHKIPVNYMETTCVALINELQKIWDEVGEPEKDRDKMLLELEQECLEAYRRKVDQASRFRAQLRQAVADSEAKLAYICASLGEQSLPMKQFEASCLKKELAAIFPQLEMMEKKKSERKLQFIEILDQIHNISKELCTFTDKQCIPVINESDLSLRRLEEFKTELQSLEKEKSDRMKKVLDHLNTLQSLCVVLGMDFKTTLNEIHPTLDNPGNKRSISADTIDRLSIAVSTLNEIKIQRLQRVQDLATTMVELWNLMDISDDEQQPFHNVSRYIAASENEVTEPNALSVESIKFTETEISRLQQLKASKIKEVLLKKRADLEQLYKQAHMPDVMHGAIDFSVETLESGAVDPLYLLEQVENQISNVKEEAFSRKDILEKLDKWLAACEEETWLEEYNMDHNRYNACRGTHLLLKRAEKARTLVHKIPAMVETLREKTRAWEQKRGAVFSYDGVSVLSMLDDYDILKQEKDQERQRQRDQKKLQGQLTVEQEARFGSKPSPLKSAKKLLKTRSVCSNDKRSAVAGTLVKTLKSNQPPISSNLNSPYNRYHSGSHAKIHAGKRNIGSSNLSNTQPESSTNEHENKTTSFRKPLSPVSSTLLFNANITSANTPYDPNTKYQKILQFPKTPVADTLSKTLSFADEDNMKTSKTMTLPIPSTPSTSLMKMAMTPFTSFVPRGDDGVEYSFEEMRAGCFPLKS